MNNLFKFSIHGNNYHYNNDNNSNYHVLNADYMYIHLIL